MTKPTPRGPGLAIVVVLLAVIALVVALQLASHVFTQHAVAPSPVTNTGTPPADHKDSGPTKVTTQGSIGVIHWRPTARTGLPLKVLDKKWFTIGYDERRKNPAWVTYDLAGPITHPGPEPTRPATFGTDFSTAAHVSHRDYTNSGFDRGHLFPAYAAWSRGGADAFTATFICSNIIPQPHAVNAGIWEELETRVAGRWSARNGQAPNGGWAETMGAVTVINGPIYGTNPEHLRSGVTVPSVDFSVVISRTANGCAALAFEIPNLGDPRGPLDRYLVSIKQVEDDAGLDMFAGETAGLRAELEPQRATAVWR